MKKKPGAPEDKAVLFQNLVSTIPEVEIKGASVLYTSLNGNMFSYLDGSGSLALRLPPSIRDEFLETHQASLASAYGIVQKEYVIVPDALLAQVEVVAPYFLSSYAYVQTLKPKPSSKTGKSH